MRGLVLDRDTVTSAVIIGIITSILAEAILLSLNYFYDVALHVKAVPLWAALLFSLSYFVAILIFADIFWRKPKKVFLLISTYGRTEFFGDLIEEIAHELSGHGFDTVIKLRTYGARGLQQDIHFQEILTEKNSYIGGLVVPVESHTRREKIAKFIEKLGKPVVFIDEDPFKYSDDYPNRTAFVGVDEHFGGELAAEEMALRFRRSVLKSNILRAIVIAGDENSVRQTAFEARITNLIPTCSVIKRQSNEFSKDEAMRLAELEIQNTANGCYTSFFCLTDEMAIAVAELINRSKSGYLLQPFVIGFDGLQRALTEIQSPDSALVATIAQNTDEIAQRAVSTLLGILAGQKVRKRELIKPTLHRRVN